MNTSTITPVFLRQRVLLGILLLVMVALAWTYLIWMASNMAISNGSQIDTDDLLYRLAEKNKIDRILIMLVERRQNLLVRDLFSCKLRGIKVIEGVDFYERFT